MDCARDSAAWIAREEGQRGAVGCRIARAHAVGDGRVEGGAPVTLRAGEVLFVPAGAIHTAKNVGRVNGAELATYIVEKGKPIVEMVE
mgnify:CR=1 FL=1